jgi:hypothetical protein
MSLKHKTTASVIESIKNISEPPLKSRPKTSTDHWIGLRAAKMLLLWVKEEATKRPIFETIHCFPRVMELDGEQPLRHEIGSDYLEKPFTQTRRLYEQFTEAYVRLALDSVSAELMAVSNQWAEANKNHEGMEG